MLTAYLVSRDEPPTVWSSQPPLPIFVPTRYTPDHDLFNGRQLLPLTPNYRHQYHRSPRAFRLFLRLIGFYWLPTWFAFVFVSSALPLNLSTRVLMPVLTRTLAWYPPPIATLDLIRARLYPLDRLSTTHHPRITDMSTGLTITDSTDTFTARLRTITNYVTRSPITTPSRS